MIAQQQSIEVDEYPLYIVKWDDEIYFDLQFCFEKGNNLELIKNMAWCIMVDASPSIFAIIDKDGNVDNLTEGIGI